MLNRDGLYWRIRPPMNKLFIGAQKDIELPERGFLILDDHGNYDAREFDPMVHSFNPLKGMNYRRAREFASIIFGTEGKDTLTVRNGKRALTKLLLTKPEYLDKIKSSSTDPGTVEAMAAIDDLLVSPVLKRVLCNPTNFSFKGQVVARLNRAELGEFDAFILGALLIGQYQGQVIVPDFGFYGCEFHTALVREERLIAGVNYLGELPEKLRQSVLTIKDKVAYRTTLEDAEKLLHYFPRVVKPSQLTELADGEFVRN